jgi:hypothetical protein
MGAVQGREARSGPCVLADSGAQGYFAVLKRMMKR